MASVPSMEACPFLTTLPVELRRQIYTYLVSFSTPLKLRQIIPGSRDLAILRTNRQVHDEALSVLYELNTIVVTRNDFCPLTDPTLKTPLRQDQARHLHLAAFSISIACTIRGPQGRCPVCQPSASGLWEALRAMPKLRAVSVDFRRHIAEFVSLRRACEGLSAREGGEGVWFQGDAVEGLEVRVIVECGGGGGGGGREMVWV